MSGFAEGSPQERDRLTCEALVDVEAGRAIDHQAVVTWADSLGKEGEFAPDAGRLKLRAGKSTATLAVTHIPADC